MIVDDKMLSPYGRAHIAQFPRKALKPVSPPANARHARVIQRDRDGRQQHAPRDRSDDDGRHLPPRGQISLSAGRYNELLDKEKRLRELESMLDKLCVFSVLDIKGERIRYIARISKKEAERLLYGQLQQRPSSLSPSLPPLMDRCLDFRLEQIEVTD